MVAVQPPFCGAFVWHDLVLLSKREGGRSMEDIIIDVDLAKRIFQLHGATGSGELIFRKRLTRGSVSGFYVTPLAEFRCF